MKVFVTTHVQSKWESSEASPLTRSSSLLYCIANERTRSFPIGDQTRSPQVSTIVQLGTTNLVYYGPWTRENKESENKYSPGGQVQGPNKIKSRTCADLSAPALCLGAINRGYRRRIFCIAVALAQGTSDQDKK